MSDNPRGVASNPDVATGLRRMVIPAWLTSRFDAEAILARLIAGEMVTALAAEYGVHRTTLSKIKSGTYFRLGQGAARV